MSIQVLRRSVGCAAVIALCGAAGHAAAAADGPYRLVQSIRIGFPVVAREFDERAGRMYVSARNGVFVIDTNARKVIGQVGKVQGGGALAIAPDLGELYVVALHENLLTVLDVTTGKVLRTYPAPSSYNVFYEASRHELYLLREFRKEIYVLNAKTGANVATIQLAGEPSFLEGEPETGRVFVRLATKDVVQVIDTKDHAIVASWPMKSAAPSWIAVDTPGRRLFVASGRSVKMIDSQSGKELASFATADEARSVVFDPATQLVMASWGGRATVARATPAGMEQLQILDPAGVSSLYLDPKSHTLFGFGYDNGDPLMDAPVDRGSSLLLVFKLVR